MTGIRTRKLGTRGVDLTVLGLGTWAIGGPWARGWGQQDDQDSIAAVKRALELGVNWIDTAAVYGRGHAEELIAKALKDVPEIERPLIMTKCGRVEAEDGTVRSEGSSAAVRLSVEESRERLQVESLDLLQMHWPPQDVTLEETWSAIVQSQEDGLVKRTGVCNVNLEQLQTIDKISRPGVVQIPLSLVKTDALADVVPYCLANGIGVIAYAPMQSGLLTGKYDAQAISRLEDGDWRKTDAEFTSPRLETNLQIVDVLKLLAVSHNCSVGEVAIAWVLAQPGVTGAIVGARNAQQVDGWVGSAKITLTDEQIEMCNSVAGIE